MCGGANTKRITSRLVNFFAQNCTLITYTGHHCVRAEMKNAHTAKGKSFILCVQSAKPPPRAHLAAAKNLRRYASGAEFQPTLISPRTDAPNLLSFDSEKLRL